MFVVRLNEQCRLNEHNHQYDYFVLELPAIYHPDRITVVGENVTIPCHSSNSNPVNWWYQRTEDRLVQELCVNGNLVNGHMERFSLNRSNYDLTLMSAKWSDNGYYTCVESTGFGTRHITRLYVRGIYHCFRPPRPPICL